MTTMTANTSHGINGMSSLDTDPITGYMDVWGQTSLYITCLYNQIAVFKLLFKYEEFAEMINIPNINGETPLYVCCYYNYIELIKIIMKIPNVKLNISNKVYICICMYVSIFVYVYIQDGNTALHAACLYNNMTVALLLIEHGADISLLNDEGKTAFEYLDSVEDVHICTKAALWGNKKSAARLLTSCGYSMWEYYGGMLVNNITRPGLLYYNNSNHSGNRYTEYGSGSGTNGHSRNGTGQGGSGSGVHRGGLAGLDRERGVDGLKEGGYSPEKSSPLSRANGQKNSHLIEQGEIFPGEEEEYNEYNDTASAINMQTMQEADIDISVNQLNVLDNSYEHLDL